MRLASFTKDTNATNNTVADTVLLSPEPTVKSNTQFAVHGDSGVSNSARRINLLKSSPFRMGLAFAAINLACFAIAGLIFYKLLQDRFLDSIDASIVERYQAINAVYESRGIEAIVEIAQIRDELPMQNSLGIHLATADGIRIAGNVPICITEPGWDYLDGSDLGLETNNKYRFYTESVGGNLLSLGSSLNQLDSLRSHAFHSFLWTFLASMLLALLGAVFMAYRTHCRIDRIANSLHQVASGNLNARLPLSSAGDDIDQLSMTINDALERLRQMVDSMRQVSTDIAHDLKTPLNRLYIQIENAAERTRQGECVDVELMGALQEAQNINGTFEALLRIAQIEAGARKAQFKTLDLNSVLETAVEVYGPVVEEHGQQLTLSLESPTALPLFGDRELLLQLVVNLIENAIRHCPAQTQITISAGFSSNGVWFSVADSGPGIPEDKRDKVFRRLYRLEGSRTTEGTGLGLSMVKAIAELHCGLIALSDNEPGLRVTVTFEFNCPRE